MKSPTDRNDFAGDASAWDLLVGGEEIVELLDFMIERLEEGKSPLEALKEVRDRVEATRPGSWPKRR